MALPVMRIPSKSLLRAFLQPPKCECQTRALSGFMPRHKYAKVTLLDKLHRKQKEALRKERLDSQMRAKSLQPPSFISSSTTDILPGQIDAASSSPVSRPVITPQSGNLAAPSLPYTISRTLTKNLPVYETSKAGGNKHITQIRKLSGDLNALQAHIREALDLSEGFLDRRGRKKENVSINWRTRQIVVRGWRGPEIKKWAEMAGF